MCFTSFETDYQLVPSLWTNCVYCVWQMELCPDTARPHYQGYMELDRAVNFSTLHGWEGLETAHFERRRGTQAQAIAYCKKEDTRMDGPYEWGVKKEQGQRSDLEEMRRDIDAGHTLAVVSRDHFPVWIKYPSAVRSYQALQARDRDRPPEVYVILGASGCGKSQLARQMFPGAYWKPSMDYWENYQYEDVIILDEFYGHCMQYTDLLRLLDSTPLLVNVKGASAKIPNCTVVFTSNQHPRYWYKPEVLARHSAAGDWEHSPLKRRLDEFCEGFIMLSPVPDGPALNIIAPVIDGQPN